MNAQFRNRQGIAIVMTHLLSAFLASAIDWPQYRGPNHDGISAENIRLNWSKEPPRLIWKRAIEPALSSFSIAGGKAYTQVRRRAGGVEQEFCVALDANTGQELWAVPLDIADYPHGGVGPDDGPRSTPTVDGNRVYVFTSYLRMACLDAATGQEIWRKNFVAELGATVAPWQNAASPLIVGDLIFLNCNVARQRLIALRKADGSVAWKGQDDPMTQATPVYAAIAEVPQIIFFAQSGLVSVARDTGAVLWRYAFPFGTSTAASPVVAGDVVYCSAAYGNGAGAVRISKTGSDLTASQIWRTPGANMNHWATPVHYGGHLYGMYGQSSVSLRCVNLETGVETWRRDGVGTGGILMVADHLLVSTDDGELILVKPDPSAYMEVGRIQAVRGRTWNVAAISDGRIYIRSTTEAAAYDVAPPVVFKPKLKLQPDPSSGAGLFGFLITGEDGSAIDSARSAKIDVFATSVLGGDPASWTKIEVRPTTANGHLRLDDVQSATTPQRFYRVVEQP